jgi:hypothetical protein
MRGILVLRFWILDCRAGSGRTREPRAVSYTVPKHVLLPEQFLNHEREEGLDSVILSEQRERRIAAIGVPDE